MAEGRRRTVSLSIAGRQYKVVTTAGDGELQRLVARVEEKVKLVGGSRGATPDAILLAAIALAHDVEQEAARADRILARATETASELLRRVDEVLGEDDEIVLGVDDEEGRDTQR